VILEILKVDYPYASHRLHTFMLNGLAERSRDLSGGPVFHYPFVEKEPQAADGLLVALSRQACAVVADDYPGFFLPAWIEEEGKKLPVRLNLVDSNGILPLRSADRTFTAAYHFRRFLQKQLPDLLAEKPMAEPLSGPLVEGKGCVDAETLSCWPRTLLDEMREPGSLVKDLSLDSAVSPVEILGTTQAARDGLEAFLATSLQRYHEDSNHPDKEATSYLSPYFHFGNLSTHEVFAQLSSWEGWTPLRLAEKTDGSRKGWWGMSPGAEAFLDQLITWRELGFNYSSRRNDWADFGSLPEWAQKTLNEHEGDPRPHIYSYEEFLGARTHDPLWNAAQRQLLDQGVIHNYLRMLWGKKILEWTPSATEALQIMVDLNDRLAVDGRDPNSYSGIMWCLGRYDRGWQERPIYGKIRSMSSERTRTKVRLEGYLTRFGPKPKS
jgi:deoxyribodipyrimidine photo-lyase